MCVVNASLIQDTYALSQEVHTVPSANVFTLLNTPISVLLRAQLVPSATIDLGFNERLAIGVGDFSQSIACKATRFRECSSTSLDRLWYLYSYIYDRVSSSTTPLIIISFLLFFVVAILMSPTTRSNKSPLVSPSPSLPQTRSFTMTDFTTLTDFSFRFNPHPHSEPLDDALNDTYSKPFEDATVAAFYTTAGRTTLVPDIVARLCAAVIDIIDATSQADRTVIASIINGLILSVKFGQRRFPLRSPATITKALLAHTTVNKTGIVVFLNTVSLHIAASSFNVLTFDGISINGPVAPTAPTGGGTGAGAGAATITAAQAATAAAQATAAQQAAQAAILAATLPANFNVNNLPPDVKARHLHYLDSGYLLTAGDLVPFPTATGGACPSFSHLDPPMGTGVTRQPDSILIIARNGQFFPLADQGNSGLKVFFSSVPACIGTSSEAVRVWYLLFTQMASATGVYIHPCFCFRKDADSNYGFTCGFDTGAIAAVAAAPEIPHRPLVPVVAARVHVPANATTGAARITAHPGSPDIPEQLHVSEVFASAATPAVQHDLPGVFGAKISVWTNHIWVALTKGKCSK